MRPRFQADADFNHKIVRGIKRQEPAVDFQSAHMGGVIGLPDPDILMRAAEFGRLLISHDKKTMLQQFARFLHQQSSPGLILVPQHLEIGVVIEDLMLIWAATDAEEWRDRVDYLPL